MAAILAIAFLVLCVVCACVESKTTGLFKTFGVYRRFGAYMSLFAPLGIGMFIASFFMEDVGAERWGYLAVSLLGIIALALAYIKCPAFLKKKVIFCMLVSGFGVCMKIIIFFIGGVWKLAGPQEMSDADGNTVYVYGGEVYTSGGKHIGTATPDRKSYIVKQ